MEVIEASLDDAGRDRDDLNVSWLCTLVLGDDEAEAEARLRDMVAERGMDPAMLDDDDRAPHVAGPDHGR